MGAAGTFYEGKEETLCSVSSSSGINGIACANKALMEKDFS